MTEEQYKQAESFWTRKDEAEKKMDSGAVYSWINDFLSAHKVLALATAAEDFVRCTPLDIHGMMMHSGFSLREALNSGH